MMQEVRQLVLLIRPFHCCTTMGSSGRAGAQAWHPLHTAEAPAGAVQGRRWCPFLRLGKRAPSTGTSSAHRLCRSGLRRP